MQNPSNQPEALGNLTTQESPPMSDQALRASITELSACITVATAQLLMLIAELDRREAWGDGGLKSCAHWLNWQCGIALGAAREKIRVARALEFLPLITTAFGNGEISYSKVRAMTRVANESNKEYLLMIARYGTAAHMENLVRGYRRVQRNEERANVNAIHDQRAFSHHWDEDGALVIQARLPAESGALILKALAAAKDDLNTQRGQKNVSADTPGTKQATAAARRADAFAQICQDYLTNPTQTQRPAERYQVTVEVTQSNLTPEIAEARLKEGPNLCLETLERLCCDASVVPFKKDHEGKVLDVGRKQRTVPTALRRALQHTD